MAITSEETAMRMAELRNKINVEGPGSLTLEEAREVVKLVRADRCSAVQSSKKPARGSKAKNTPDVNTGDLFDELDNL